VGTLRNTEKHFALPGIKARQFSPRFSTEKILPWDEISALHVLSCVECGLARSTSGFREFAAVRRMRLTWRNVHTKADSKYHVFNHLNNIIA
jgi:hypothetical protein